MQTIQDLLSVLEVSERKHGADHPVTIGHLVNILKMVEKRQIKRIEREELEEELFQDIGYGWDHRKTQNKK